MGKTDNQSNKKHRHKKDKRKHKERSKEEHLKKKQKLEQEKFESTRYILEDHEYHKIIRLIQDLIKHNPNTKDELPEVFKMLDNGSEVDIIDIEDLIVRDKLERMFEMLSKQIERREDRDGGYMYARSGTKSLETQIREYVDRANEDISRPEWMRSIADTLSHTLGPVPLPEPTQTSQEQERMAQYMEEYNKTNRPVSLMEMHMNKKGPKAKLGGEQYLYGHKTIDKRFSSGKFYSQFS